jgi:hypothetical protein
MVTAPKSTVLCALYTTSGATGALSNEAMSNVDLTAVGYTAYTVYEITAAAKRYLPRTETFVFEADTSGDGKFATVTPTKVDYPGGRIYLSAARNSDDVVRCASGKYYTTITPLLGASVSKLNFGPQLVEVPLLGDSYVRRFPTVTDWTFNVDAYKCKGVAEYTTNLAGATNNDLTFYHSGGTAGNSITIELSDPGVASPLSVAVAGNVVTVTLASSAVPAVTSTANQVMDLVNSDGKCVTLGFRAKLAPGNTGIGLMASTGGAKALTGGLNAQDHTAKKGVELIAIFYYSTSGDARYEGYCQFESEDWTFDPKSVQIEALSFKGNGPLYRRTS